MSKTKDWMMDQEIDPNWESRIHSERMEAEYYQHSLTVGRIIEGINSEINKLDVEDTKGHLYWNKFKQFILNFKH